MEDEIFYFYYGLDVFVYVFLRDVWERYILFYIYVYGFFKVKDFEVEYFEVCYFLYFLILKKLIVLI